MKKLNAKKLIGALAKALLGVIVLTYLGLHTINFFTYTFPPEQWYLAWLGFGLTGGGAIIYLVIFLWEADSVLKRVTALLMTLVCAVGEILAAGFGMQIEAWARNGWTMTQTDFDMMLLAVRILALLHAIALAVYIAGDQIFVMFQDDDKDGTPNFADRDYKKNKGSTRPAFAQTVNQPAPQHSLDEFLKVTGLTKDQARAKYADRQAFMDYVSGQFDYISGGNMKRMHGELMGQGNGSNPQTGQRH